jgi:hypothetical protein
MKKLSHKKILLDTISSIGEVDYVGRLETHRGYQEVTVQFSHHPCVFNITRSWMKDGRTRKYRALRYDKADGGGWVNVCGPFVNQDFCGSKKELIEWVHYVWNRDEQRHFDFTHPGVAGISFIGAL